MPQIVLNDAVLKVGGIAFDKDGTLVDFNYLWAPRISRWLNALLRETNREVDVDLQELRHSLNFTLGYDPFNDVVIPDSPLAIASMRKISAVAMGVIYQQGIPWYIAESIVERVDEIVGASVEPEFVRPIGDVFSAMQNFKRAELALGVITSDDRSSTEETLPILGIDDLVDVTVCGDDPLPNKPNPAGMYHIAERTQVDVNQFIMVGDTVSDMMCGRRAGAAACIGVLGGAGDADALSEYADFLIPSIETLAEGLSWR